MNIMVASPIDIPTARLKAFARKWQIRSIDLFGSALRDDFRPESDIDLLVEFEPEAGWSLIDHVTMQEEAQAIFGRKVDLVDRESVQQSRNWIRRRAILESARPVYAHSS